MPCRDVIQNRLKVLDAVVRVSVGLIAPTELTGAKAAGPSRWYLRMSDIIRTQLIGTNMATACGIETCSRRPILTLCRALIKPDTTRHHRCIATEATRLALTIKSIGDGTKLSVRENEKEKPSFIPSDEVGARLNGLSLPTGSGPGEPAHDGG